MPIDPEQRKKIQIFLLAGMLVAGGRAAYVVYDRYQQRKADEKPKHEAALKADYYVTPRRLRPYDLESAKDLTKQPVWTKVGYGYTYFPFDAARRKADFNHAAGTLAPLQKLQVLSLFVDRAPGAKDTEQVMARFDLDGKPYAVQIGLSQQREYRFYVDDMFFIQDPHELYNHWPADVWKAIDDHQVQPGMSELQAGFAIGLGTPEGSGEYGSRTLNYPNGGKQLTVTFRNDKAVEIKNTPGA